MKYQHLRHGCFDRVTPYAGVWIEMTKKSEETSIYNVTPYAGVWIEMIDTTGVLTTHTVTPYAGVWIEIVYTVVIIIRMLRHSLCGSVD